MRTIGLVTLLLSAVAAQAAVEISLPAPVITQEGTQTQTAQPVSLSNEVCSYTLNYDYTVDKTKPNEATSHYWAWTTGYIPIGMTGPAQANWYWQAFVSWVFDDEDLSKRPATLRVVRSDGADGLIEFAWDTPKVKASLFFGLAGGSDKLLMFGQYEPKTPIKQSRLGLSCYPATFEAPHNRCITTAVRSTGSGETLTLDLAQERWVLYEDVTPGRAASGSAGLVIGTPESFASVTMPSAGYQIVTTLLLKPEARSFGLGLYDFPTMPDYQKTREHFRTTGDADAVAVGKLAAAGVAKVFAPMPIEGPRQAELQAAKDAVFARGTERWQPEAAPLAFPWARKLAGGPVRASLLVPRYRAWETMELARRLDLKVRHLYFDGDSALTNPDYWPYAATTGQGAIPYGLANERGQQMVDDPDCEVIVVASLTEKALPRQLAKHLLEQVQAGKGLLLAGDPGRLGSWPAELFKQPEAQVASTVLAGLAWDQIPGYREGERGRSDPPVQVYRYGQGRVVVLRLLPTTYGALAPVNDAVEGLEGALDRSLALAARAVLCAARRPLPYSLDIAYDSSGRVALGIDPVPQQAVKAVVRVQDDLDRTVLLKTFNPVQEQCLIPSLAAGRRHYVDVAILGAQGETLGYGFGYVPGFMKTLFPTIKLSPAEQPAGVLTPKVLLPNGGKLQVWAQVEPAARPLRLRAEVRDSFGRVLGRHTQMLPAKTAQVSFSLSLGRPVTVAHLLDLWLEGGDTRALGLERKRFAIALPYPHADFTGLMWSYAGGDPVLRRTDRLCYNWGADMADLCHMMGADDNGKGGRSDAAAAREYGISARSGLRLLPYVTRIAGEGNERHERTPCLHDPDYLQRTTEGLVRTCRQAAPYTPAAYTLGDENYLFNGRHEVCQRAESVAAFRQWLTAKYRTIETLNEAWDSRYASFEAIDKPLLLAEAAAQEYSFAPWIDHKLFMNEAFAATHDRFDAAIKTVDSQAKVGFDGFLGFNWQSGYDFARLTQNLRLNQTYTTSWLQGQLVRSFKQPGALTGMWGNSDADREDGWHAFPWHCLLNGDNSAWWWTSWGCDYIPFNPDTSQSEFGKWFYESLTKATQGPGKLLLHARREDSGVAVMHSEPDLMAAAVAYAQGQRAPWAGDGPYLREEEAILHGIQDAGLQARSVTPEQVMAGLDPTQTKQLWLPYASCLSDAMAVALHKYVEAGGTLVLDGRAGLLTGDGKLREQRPLAALMGVTSEAGAQGWARQASTQKVTLNGQEQELTLLEPGLKITTGVPGELFGKTPVRVTNRVGKGLAITLNVPLADLLNDRFKPGRQLSETLVAFCLEQAPVAPFALVRDQAGQEPRCLQQVGYSDGKLRYLALMADFRVRAVPAQDLTVHLSQPTYVYEILSGKPIGQGKTGQWHVTVGRGYPALYALLPYELKTVGLQAPRECAAGTTATLGFTVKVSTGKPDYHVVRLEVFAPGTTVAHRQYSQNVACPEGKGVATIPFALNDARGVWRLQWHDVATGSKGQGQIVVK